MNKVKFFQWNIEKINDNQVKISFNINNINNVDKIISSFNTIKDILETKNKLDSLSDVFNMISNILGEDHNIKSIPNNTDIYWKEDATLRNISNICKPLKKIDNEVFNFKIDF